MLKGFWIDMTSITIILEDDKTIQITEWKTSELVTITEGDQFEIGIYDVSGSQVRNGVHTQITFDSKTGDIEGLTFEKDGIELLIPILDIFRIWQSTGKIVGTRNKGEAKARFTIDHTPPVIEFEGIEDGEKYEKEKTFYVRTENLEDQIEYIKINGKKQNRKKQKKGYEIQLNEAKNYEIEVKAKDFAGNEKVSQIGFEIYEEKSLWQKIVEPVRKYIFYGNEKVIQDEKMVKEDKKEGKKKNIILWERAVLFGALIVVGIWKREKVKEIWKNLS